MIEILAPGPLTVLQDLGRPDYAELGVGRCGAADQRAHRLANRLVGNPDAAATLEVCLGGLAICLAKAATIALTGARCSLEPGHLDWNRALSLPAGTTLSLGSPTTGLRSYLAIRGGFDVEAVLGSRSYDTLAGLGPASLRAGDRLPVGSEIEGEPADDAGLTRILTGTVAVLPGPRADWFGPAALDLLCASAWQVRLDSDRIGVRLDGPALARSRPGELPPEPTLPGAVQVPPSGLPIVLGPDCPVTGGYPVIAVVASRDLDILAQFRPGDPLHFRPG